MCGLISLYRCVCIWEPESLSPPVPCFCNDSNGVGGCLLSLRARWCSSVFREVKTSAPSSVPGREASWQVLFQGSLCRDAFGMFFLCCTRASPPSGVYLLHSAQLLSKAPLPHSASEGPLVQWFSTAAVRKNWFGSSPNCTSPHHPTEAIIPYFSSCFWPYILGVHMTI